ncbi:MAG: 2-oxoacid:acceptor oxidoreductase family protein [Fimbriimonadaceae bacterium]|nr:2-oxoacid:acceptor oxidoreductase family protein [Fimbriimonadaceae bacterium]
MIEIVIFGRGGQGGVTLAKLIANTYFLQGKFVQAFGVYAAERSGAPLNAFVRIDDREITNRNQIYEPDHVIVLDRSLVGERIVAGLKPGGWILFNSPEPPEHWAQQFPGYRIATVDATKIAVANELGTQATPIVNTTLLGAVARMFETSFASAEAAMEDFRFDGPNVVAARTAYESVEMGGEVDAEVRRVAPPGAPPYATSLLDPSVGGPPAIGTGAWATQRPLRREWTPPCNDGCPAGNDIRGFLAAVKDQEFDRALAILHQTTPFPAICGRVCPGPCLEACHRRHLDESVNIRELERYVGDHATAEPVREAERPESVAVVGSGPAGLSASYHLAKLGYRVTLVEADEELGGVMRTGIPAYRLPREVLDREIAFILRHGVNAETGSKVDRERLLALSRTHDAVFVATGLQEARNLNLGVEDPEHISQGIVFLDDARRGTVRTEGERVAVIGGGNTAMDAARTALRLGAREVRVIYRRTRAEMPAIREEIDEAVEEGVQLLELAAPVRLDRTDSGVTVTCLKMTLGEPDESGRRSPVPDSGPNAEFTLPCDRVILALGQLGDHSIFPEGSEISGQSVRLGLAGAPIFAGGDLATNDGTVAAAIASGRKATLHIHRTLSGEDLFPAEKLPVIPEDEMRFARFEQVPQHRGQELGVAERLQEGFVEVRRGLVDSPDHGEALAEAARCLSCGGCNFCNICRDFCPEGVLVRTDGAYAFDYDYCKGCGLCSSECPRGVIFMEQV